MHHWLQRAAAVMKWKWAESDEECVWFIVAIEWPFDYTSYKRWEWVTAQAAQLQANSVQPSLLILSSQPEKHELSSRIFVPSIHFWKNVTLNHKRPLTHRIWLCDLYHQIKIGFCSWDFAKQPKVKTGYFAKMHMLWS